MKKNNLRYLLGLILIIVWGLLGFRIYHKMNKSTNVHMQDNSLNLEPAKNEARVFNLSLDYNDPFLKKQFKPKPKFVKRNNNSQAPVIRQRVKNKPGPKKRQKVRFPQIVYKGNIQTKEGRMVALLSVNEKFMQLAENEKYHEMTLLKVYRDSIRISYLESEKLIMRLR